MSYNLKEINNDLNSLIIFKNLKYSPAFQALMRLNGDYNVVKSYSEFISSIISNNLNFTEYVKDLVFTDENIYTSLICNKKDVDFLKEQLDLELSKIYKISTLEKSDFPEQVINNFRIFPTYSEDFSNEYFERIKTISKTGFGVFANNYVFHVDNNGDLKATESYNIRKLKNIYSYDRERQKVIENTKALVEGKPCCNVLLYGDAGTGKSSSIKAIASENFKEGLRLIEVETSQITTIPDIVSKLANNPLKFIIFIDDITFSSDDPNFCALKTILDGNSKGLPSNVSVYATSNHRHLIKETTSDREGDVVNANDNIQDIMGLCARFGLCITFTKPDRYQFADIVTSLADEKGLEYNRDKLLIKAEAYAIRNGGRTPRCAGQFIDLVYSGIEKI